MFFSRSFLDCLSGYFVCPVSEAHHELQDNKGREEGRSKRGWEGGELFFCACVQRVTFAPDSSTVA